MLHLLALALASPTVPEGAVFSLASSVDDGALQRAGHAFAVTWDGDPVVLSALHLAGPGGGHERQLTAEEVPYALTLRLEDITTGNAYGATSKGLRRMGVPYDETGATLQGDVMAFEAPAAKKKKAGPPPPSLRCPSTLAAPHPARPCGSSATAPRPRAS